MKNILELWPGDRWYGKVAPVPKHHAMKAFRNHGDKSPSRGLMEVRGHICTLTTLLEETLHHTLYRKGRWTPEPSGTQGWRKELS